MQHLCCVKKSSLKSGNSAPHKSGRQALGSGSWLEVMLAIHYLCIPAEFWCQRVERLALVNFRDCAVISWQAAHSGVCL